MPDEDRGRRVLRAGRISGTVLRRGWGPDWEACVSMKIVWEQPRLPIAS